MEQIHSDYIFGTANIFIISVFASFRIQDSRMQAIKYLSTYINAKMILTIQQDDFNRTAVLG